jgi:lipid A ethanolaminephosphotransferase
LKSPSLPSQRKGTSSSDHNRLSLQGLRHISTERLAILASLFFSLTANHLFFSAALSDRNWSHGSSWLFALAIFIAITALHAAVLLLLLNRWSAKPVLTILLIVTAGASFYMDKYTVFFDPDMVRNI